MPKYSFFAGIAFFASLGLPGFSGFIGEFFAIMGAVNTDLAPLIWTAIAVSGIVLGAGYLLWTYQKVFLGKEYLKDPDWQLEDLKANTMTSFFILGLITLILGVYPEIIFKFTNTLIENLFLQIFN